MIVFLTPAESTYTMEGVLARSDFAEVRSRFDVVSYETFFARPVIPKGSLVLSALDQLTPTGVELAARLCDAVTRAAPGAMILNSPRRTLRRLELLQAAFESGRNRFRVSRASAAFRPHRFPVFIRCEAEHTGNLTPLLRSHLALDRALAVLLLRGYRLRDLLIVEFLDTRNDAGLIRKYAAFAVGDTVIPRTVYVSREWMVKDEDRIFDPDTVREELDYATTNPHGRWLRDIFTMAGVGYGRADYGVLDGEPQLWEINLAPTIGMGPAGHQRRSRRTDAQREMMAPARNLFHQRLREAFDAVDSSPRPSGTVEISIDVAEAAELRREMRQRERVRARRTPLSSVARPPVRLLKRLAALVRRGKGEPA